MVINTKLSIATTVVQSWMEKLTARVSITSETKLLRMVLELSMRISRA